ncbi:MAG: prephenate dehydrogenase/arogenate dehydrogenase family protein [Gaiellales bacterium]
MKVAIAGLGLMGGSLGMALRAAGHRVAGFDRDPAEAALAVERGCADHAADSLVEAAADADLVVVATPVSQIAGLVAEALAANPRATVTDIGSTKGQVMAAVPADGRARVVGGHPICGSEAHGAAAARAELYAGATWFLTPTLETDPERLAQVHALVVAVGARPVVVDADAHDRIVALTSHVPHVLANVLALQVAEGDVDGHRPLDSTGGSFRDMTRVAGANPAMWIDILLDNRAAVLAAIEDARGRLGEVADALERGDDAYLERWIGGAREARRETLARAHHTAPADLVDLVVSVPDRPGAISAIALALSKSGIDIAEFALSHSSPEAGGEIRIVVAGDGQADRAVEVLRAEGCAAFRAEPGGAE